MNLGGPAHHVSLLSGRLAQGRLDTLLVAGEVGAGEASASALAIERGVRLRMSRHLGPSLDPRRDALALRELIGLVRAFRPDIVHTHTAKAGMLGRLAALAGRPRPKIVHTYHGHVLEGYFGPVEQGVYRILERGLSRVSDRLIGVSQPTVDDLVRLGIAPRERFRVVPLGLDLADFAALPPGRSGPLRTQLGIGDEAMVCTFVGRLVPIKRVDVLLRAVAAADRDLVLLVVGDGELRAEIEMLAARLRIAERVRFLGYRTDLPDLAAASDVAVLSSANEGTPVALIEAGAAAVPALATRVGGVEEVVAGDGGLLVDDGDVDAYAAALRELFDAPERRATMGRAARAHMLGRFGAQRLVDDVCALYDELLAERAA